MALQWSVVIICKGYLNSQIAETINTWQLKLNKREESGNIIQYIWNEIGNLW